MVIGVVVGLFLVIAGAWHGWILAAPIGWIGETFRGSNLLYRIEHPPPEMKCMSCSKMTSNSEIRIVPVQLEILKGKPFLVCNDCANLAYQAIQKANKKK